MSRIKLLLDVVEDMSELTADLKRLVDAMAGDEPREQTEVREPETVVTIEGVRAVLSRKAVKDVREMLNEFGLKKLSEADPNDYRKLLEKAEELCSWAEDIKDFAYREALTGRKWPGYKLVEGRSVRKYTDERMVAATVTAKGYDPYEKKLLGITEIYNSNTKYRHTVGAAITSTFQKAEKRANVRRRV